MLYFPAGATKATRVYGQFGEFTSGVSNNNGKNAHGTPSAEKLNGVQEIAVGSDGRVYINDTNNNRMLMFVKP